MTGFNAPTFRNSTSIASAYGINSSNQRIRSVDFQLNCPPSSDVRSVSNTGVFLPRNARKIAAFGVSLCSNASTRTSITSASCRTCDNCDNPPRVETHPTTNNGFNHGIRIGLGMQKKRGEGRNRTVEWGFCRALPYHLATPPSIRTKSLTCPIPSACQARTTPLT